MRKPGRVSEAIAILQGMAIGSTCHHCGTAGTAHTLPAVHAAGTRMARTSTTTTIVGGMLAVRSRSLTRSSSLLATQLRPPARHRSPSRPAAVAAGCAALALFILYGLLATPTTTTQDVSAALFMAAVLTTAAGMSAVIAAARWRRTRQTAATTARAMSVWRAGTWCANCHNVTLPVPGAGPLALLSAEHAHRVHNLASIDATAVARPAS